MIVAFGPRWYALETADAAWVATPTGETCAYCNTDILLGDQGQIMAVGHADGTATTAVAHAGCSARTMIGHQHGVCRCNGWADDSRAGGDELWRRLGHTPIGDRAFAEWIDREAGHREPTDIVDAVHRLHVTGRRT